MILGIGLSAAVLDDLEPIDDSSCAASMRIRPRGVAFALAANLPFQHYDAFMHRDFDILGVDVGVPGNCVSSRVVDRCMVLFRSPHNT